MGVPESAVYGNLTEIPDSESGEDGPSAVLEFPNETAPTEEVSGASEKPAAAGVPELEVRP